jgi:tetratricopeptide (TPR) repeat protein
MRLVGRAQFNLKAFEGARATWEAVRAQDPLDVEANTQLGTIYQRLGDLTSSTQALKRVLSLDGLEKRSRAEVRSLLGRNAKSHWTREWRRGTSLPDRQRRALVSPYLEESFEAYEAAFKEDLNHFYSGLSTLATLTIQTKLAELMPAVWAERFDDDDSAERELKARNATVQKLSASVDLSLKAAAERLEREQRKDVWVESSEADLCFLTSNRPAKVSNAYRRALVDAPAFLSDTVRRQLNVYQDLGLLKENVEAVLSMLEPAPS